MILTVVRVCWLGLLRDRVALGLTFVLPVVFFSIFAWVFGQQERGLTKQLEVGLVDEDQSEASRRLYELLRTDPSIDARTTQPRVGGEPMTREIAQRVVREGRAPVGIVIPRGFGDTFGSLDGRAIPIDVLADRSDPVAPQLVFGLLQKSAFAAAPDMLLQQGVRMFEKYAGGLTAAQRAAIDLLLPTLRPTAATGTTDSAPAGSTRPAPRQSPLSGGLVQINVIDVFHSQHELASSPAISFYAAGTGVMFLLFMASGAGGSLLEEHEAGTLERLLSSRIRMGQLLAGKWIYITVLGFIQVSVMFLWGWLVFGMNLFTPNHLAGFAVMALVSASAAGGFGLCLATLCRSRAQLSGISTILILVMSAIGGSMFPRFMMPASMQQFGYITFNAWALDGFHKVFWRDFPINELWPEVSVLIVLTLVLLAAARFFARRWEVC